MSFSFFFALPTPLKIVFFIVGGLFWVGARKEARPAQAQAVEEAVQPPKKVPEAPAKPAKAIVVQVNSDGSFILAGEKLTSEQLQKKLKALVTAKPNSRVVLKADALTPHQMVVNGLKLCQKAGIKRISFASKQATP